MKPICAALALVIVAEFAGTAIAARTPTGAEKQAIEKAIGAKLRADESPVAGTEVVSGIRISTKAREWASAVMEAPYAATAFVALERQGSRWKVRQYGTAQVPCGIGMPAPVRRELFKGRGGGAC